MAKVGLTKLGLEKNLLNKTSNLTINEQVIEIKQYLPINEKLALISKVINQSILENNFINPVQIEVYSMIGFIEFYTNITLTDKQKEDIGKLYDLLESNHIFQQVIDQIPEEEYNFVIEGIEESIEAYYKYKHSILGILDSISQDYSNLNLDASKIQKEIADPENLKLLKDIMNRLG